MPGLEKNQTRTEGITRMPIISLPEINLEGSSLVCLAMKACVRYFLSNFHFSPNDSPSKNMKNVFLFHIKSSFRSRDIHIFVILFSPLFLPVSHL